MESATPCLDAADFAAMRDRGIVTAEFRALRGHVDRCARCQEAERGLEPLLRWMPGCFANGPLGFARDRPSERGPDCPDPFELVSLLRGVIDAERARSLRAHAADCGRCAADFAEILRGRDAALSAPDPLAALATASALGIARTAPATRTSKRWNWAASLAAAASLAGLALLSSTGGLPVATAPPTVAPSADRSTRSPIPEPILLAPVEGQRMPRAGLEFRWQTVARARSYQATVLDDRGRTVWHESASTNALAIPASVLLHPGSRYFVVVVAQLEDGSMARAPAVAFFVDPIQGP